MSDLVGTVAQVARRLEVSPERVRRLIREGKLPAWRMGPQTIRIPWKALEEYVNGQATVAAANGHTANGHTANGQGPHQDPRDGSPG